MGFELQSRLYGYVVLRLRNHSACRVYNGNRRQSLSSGPSNALALEASEGQSIVGSWGHNLRGGDGRLVGYGMMNAPGSYANQLFDFSPKGRRYRPQGENRGRKKHKASEILHWQRWQFPMGITNLGIKPTKTMGNAVWPQFSSILTTNRRGQDSSPV